MQLLERDLGARPLPHVDEAFALANLKPVGDRDSADTIALTLSEMLIAEIEAAEAVVLSTPMYNFATPSVLKAWIDLVLRPGRTFRGTPRGKVGLLPDRPTFVIVACGGGFEDGAQIDYVDPYLRYVFKTMGIFDLRILRLEELNRGPQKLEVALARARTWIENQLPEPVRRSTQPIDGD